MSGNDRFNSNALPIDIMFNKVNAGFWEFDVYTNEVKWSEGFYQILGYELNEIESSYLNFKDNLIYYEDKELFLGSLNGQSVNQLKGVQIRLLTKRGYEWFQSTMQKQKNAKITGTLISIHKFKIAEFQSKLLNSENTENNQLVKMGGWKIVCGLNEHIVNGDGLAILDVLQKSISVEALVRLVDPFDKIKLEVAIADCMQHSRPFEMDFPVKTAFKNKKWIKIKGHARINHFGVCYEINGTLQDIDWAKKKEEELESLLNDVGRQKDKLQNFAHIVAHNINSYANNLKFMVELHDQSKIEKDRGEVFAHIKGLSSSLTTTISHLNEIVNSEAQEEELTMVEFASIFNNTINALYSNIQMVEASVISDFSQCTEIYYLPAYLESIFHNMISNSLKYREPSRKTVIKCETKNIKGSIYLTFEDNGIGIDMEKYGSKLFGMHQTFHSNRDAHGLGLYITRNQVEQCGGTINVESELNKGTKFIILLSKHPVNNSRS